jgi:indole-3-glycerol phosphate synthase
MGNAEVGAVPDVLARQLLDARHRVAAAAATEPLGELRARALDVPAGPSLTAVLSAPGTSVIAEVKRASPSRGPLATIGDPVAQARAYAAGGAAAVSVLTAPLGFDGDLGDLAAVATLGLPTLRKDFLVDPRQVWEARAVGASAVLLIAMALDDATLADLAATAEAAGLDVLLEVHDAAEMARAAAHGARLVGVNVRDLRDFSVDRDRFAALAALRPSGAVLVAESGVRGPADVRSYAEAGADAVLVGEHLVTSPDPTAATAELVAAGRGGAGPVPQGDRP